MNDEENDAMKIIILHASKKQRINIRKKSKSINKLIKRSCWACEKKNMKFKNVDIFFLILHLNFLSFLMLCSNNFWNASKTITNWRKKSISWRKKKHQTNQQKKNKAITWQSQSFSSKVVSAAFLINVNKKSKSIDVLNSEITVHVCNEIIRFYFFRSTLKSYIQIEISTISIIEYDFIRVFIIRSNNSKKIFRFQNVVYCLKFVINLISIYMLRKKDIHFDSEINLLYKRVLINRQQICFIFWINHFSCFQHQETFIKSVLSTFIVFRTFSKNDAWLWHTRMKHSK